MILAVTGITKPPEPTSREAFALYSTAVDRVEQTFEQPSELMTGCAFGIDTDSINYFLIRWQGEIEKLHLIVPAAPYNVAWVNMFLNGVHPNMPDKIVIRRMPRRKQGFPKAYMERNDYLADNADAACAFPHTAIEEQRSGTWATVRRFEKRGKQVILVPTRIA